MSGGTGVFGSIGYAQRQATLMQEEREMFAAHVAAILDDEGVAKAVAEVDRRARETSLTWLAASRQVAHEIAMGEVAMSGPSSAWTCPICGQRFSVPSLARDCEARCREIVWVESGRKTCCDGLNGLHNLLTCPTRVEGRIDHG